MLHESWGSSTEMLEKLDAYWSDSDISGFASDTVSIVQVICIAI